MADERGRAAPPTDRARTALGIGTVCSGLVLAALPVFLVSGLAVQIREELGFSEAALGAAVSAAFLTAAGAAPLTGRLADRIGPRAAVLAGNGLSVAALAGIGLAARGWASVTAMLVVAGLGLAVTNPGLVSLVARAVPATRRGLVFGSSEASIPAATLAAGLAVPFVALTLGWRWAFLVGLLPLAGVALLLPRVTLLPAPAAGQPGDEGDRLPRGGLLLLTLAAALGIGAASGVGVFLTQSAVAMGMSPAGAGLLLAAGSAAGILTRVGTGVLADRHGGEQFRRITWMLAAGAVTMALGASGSDVLLVAGTIGAFTGAWGWSALLFLSLVRATPGAPGAASGWGVAGLASGNGLGPLAFGAVADAASFRAAWLCAAVAAAAAALLMHLARARILRYRAGISPGAGSR